MKSKKSLSKYAIIGTVPIVALVLFGFAKVHYATLNGKQVEQLPLSQEQTDKISHNISQISTPYGDFIRTDKQVNLPSDEITNDKNVAATNDKIKEIVLPYGVFVKTTPEGLKAFDEQLKAKQLEQLQQMSGQK